jgi:hypothetical protein
MVADHLEEKGTYRSFRKDPNVRVRQEGRGSGTYPLAHGAQFSAGRARGAFAGVTRGGYPERAKQRTRAAAAGRVRWRIVRGGGVRRVIRIGVRGQLECTLVKKGWHPTVRITQEYYYTYTEKRE